MKKNTVNINNTLNSIINAFAEGFKHVGTISFERTINNVNMLINDQPEIARLCINLEAKEYGGNDSLFVITAAGLNGPKIFRYTNINIGVIAKNGNYICIIAFPLEGNYGTYTANEEGYLFNLICLANKLASENKCSDGVYQNTVFTKVQNDLISRLNLVNRYIPGYKPSGLILFNSLTNMGLLSGEYTPLLGLIKCGEIYDISLNFNGNIITVVFSLTKTELESILTETLSSDHVIYSSEYGFITCKEFASCICKQPINNKVSESKLEEPANLLDYISLIDSSEPSEEVKQIFDAARGVMHTLNMFKPDDACDQCKCDTCESCVSEGTEESVNPTDDFERVVTALHIVIENDVIYNMNHYNSVINQPLDFSKISLDELDHYAKEISDVIRRIFDVAKVPQDS